MVTVLNLVRSNLVIIHIASSWRPGARTTGTRVPSIPVRVRYEYVRGGTKGETVQIDPADRTPRETLEKRLEKSQVTLVISHRARP